MHECTSNEKNVNDLYKDQPEHEAILWKKVSISFEFLYGALLQFRSTNRNLLFQNLMEVTPFRNLNLDQNFTRPNLFYKFPSGFYKVISF